MLKIELNEKISEISEENLIEIFCFIDAFNIIETKKGNEYEKAWIKLKYEKEMLITEYINIFNLVRVPTFYEFIKYFLKIEEKFDTQDTNTRIDLTDYIYGTENLSQEIIIIMVFKIVSEKKEVEKTQKLLIETLKAGGIDKRIFEMFKNKVV